MFGRQSSLKSFIFVAILGVSLITFVFIGLVTTSVYHRAYSAQAQAMSRGVAGQISGSLLQLMERGWTRKELLTFLAPVVRANPQMPVGVALYRADSVTGQYGAVDAAMRDKAVREVMASGVSRSFEKDNVLSEVVAVKAESACLGCHEGAAPGDVLGVLSINQDLSASIWDIQRTFILVFLFLSPLPFLMGWLVSRWVTRRVARATTLLHGEIKNVNSVKDLTALRLDSDRTDFAEINAILAEFSQFADKMRDVAIDKDLLAFEVNLLETFIITSDVVKDWRDHVAKLLNQVNDIMDAYVLFSIFDTGDETYDLEVFWRSRPSAKTRHYFDQVVSQRLSEHRRMRPLSEIKTRHNIVNFDGAEMTIGEEQLDLQTKSIFLENPQIGGVVGLGVHSDLREDEGRALVIESILTTLINVIGSVKAIYNYTKELEYYATRDPLTNLYNQRVFWDLAENELLRAQSHDYSFGTLIVDLDNFKLINDRYGHSFGDTFLKVLAERLKKTLNAGDILTRYGGDEFAIILPESDQGKTYATALKVIEAVKETFVAAPDGKSIKASVSIGLSVFPEHSAEMSTLFVIANNMMYKAKSEGKNRIGVPTREDIIEVLKATEEKTLFLLNVLENRDRVIPFFQPIMDIGDGSIPMHELLMGIEHEGKILPAGQFIEMAEDMGIVSQLDYINIEKAFQEVRKKDYQGMLFINLSPKSLILSEFIQKVRSFATQYKIAPEQIVFEITERETVKNTGLLDKFVKDLKLEGFKFAIDDFGAGFSTFHYIKVFPVDYIKIEGEFIRNVNNDPTDRAFVKSIISLAKDLGVKTVAEMIENEQVLQTVRELGADYGQGYHIQVPDREL
ncbi:putative bifunctional diguanylate cyclase/phosphodiesterase, partial [Trichloromonas sp.]|uniref:putative bifunctional diguanylate cyclase/phosphodiesterase n=1 Tax=Trichloromonas sp. TaxID=3069249 RepID=UPI003D819C5D